ncbi:MAG: hypothetical protein QOE90_1863 [Thermoplasmata archaeon]|jgi:hypothetical protein|nr:hypothetical protein [Thermoplasmata archaeon]
MPTRWLTAALVLAVLATIAPARGAEGGGPSYVLLTFPASGGAPTVRSTPTLSCGSPATSGGLWEVSCTPTTPTGAPCEDPVIDAGGTPVTIGTMSARISCGFVSATCDASWTVQGDCTQLLQGAFKFPLRCAGEAHGTSIGAGVFYAQCFLGS